MAQETRVKIAAKKSDSRAFKASDNSWYNLNDNVIPVLEKLSKGDEIIVEYEKKGMSRFVSKIRKAGETEPKKEEVQKVDTGLNCKVCNAPIKTIKFNHKCYDCNMLAKTEPKKEIEKNIPKEVKPEEPNVVATVKKEWKSYDNPEKTAQIQRGNALNASAMACSGVGFSDPEACSQMVLEVAERLLNWLRAE